MRLGWMRTVGMAVVLLAWASVAHGQWSTAQQLNPSESGVGQMKYPAVWPATGGGFHVKYNCDIANNSPADWQLKYMRYQNGSLGSPVMVHSGNMVSGGEIAESLSGVIHIVWEHWDGTGNVGWSRSTNGGISFSTPIEISSFANVPKFPRICPVGLGGSAEMVCLIGNKDDDKLWYNRFNGSSWSGTASLNQSFRSEHVLSGTAYRPTDGGALFSSCEGDLVLYNRFDGVSWGRNDAQSEGYIARPSIAVNNTGQVMLVWEFGGDFKSKLFTPATGWGATQIISTPGAYASVVAIPGSTNFYVIYSIDHPPNGPNEYWGRLWTGSAWGTAEYVSNGIPKAFSVNSDLAASPDGSLMAVWEDHGGSTARVMYAIRSGPPPSQTGTLSGTVRDQFGVGVQYASISTSGAASGLTGAGGVYSMSVPAGTYYVTASKAGYTGASASSVTISQNQTTTLDFTITGQAPAAVSSFTVTPATLINTISWTNPTSTGFAGTRILFKTTGYPSSPTDGSLLVEDVAGAGAARSVNHTGLTNGQVHYYAAYAYFADSSRFYATGVTATGTPAVKSDYDRDGDVDQADFGLFQTCYSGQNIAQTDPACASRLLDGDTDVDLADTDRFMDCYSAPGLYAAPNCAG